MSFVDILHSKQKRRKRRQPIGFIVALMVAMLAVVLVVVWRSGVAAHKDVPIPGLNLKSLVRLETVSRIYRIRQQPDNSHILWFATAEGLRRLDRSTMEWTRFGMDNGLPAEVITDLCFDNTKTMWVATVAGVAVQSKQSSQFIRIDGTAIDSSYVFAIEAMPTLPGVFASVNLRGLFRIDSSGIVEKIVIAGLSDSVMISSLKNTAGGQLLIGTENRQVFRYDGASKGIDSLVFVNPQTRGRGTYIWDMLERKGQLYVATSDNGLWRGTSTGDSITELKDFPGKGAYVLAPEHDGIWCGTPWGLWRYYDTTGVWLQFVHPQEKQAQDFKVAALYNSADTLWYGSMDIGAGMLKKTFVEWLPLRAGLSNANVAAMAAGDSSLFVAYGYQGGYIDHFTARSVQYERNYNSIDYVADPAIQVLQQWGKRLYFAGYVGFGYLDFVQGKHRYVSRNSGLPADDIVQIMPDSAGPWYLASRNGVVQYDPANESCRILNGTSHVRITSLYRHHNTLYCGTLNNGVICFDLQSGKVTDSLIPGVRTIVGIAPLDTGADSLLIVSKENGCFLRVGDSKTIIPFTMSVSGKKTIVGDYQSNIMTMAAFAGRIWLGTRSQGCLVYNPATGIWLRLTRRDGLVSNQVRSLASSNNYIWIGCYGGISRFDRNELCQALDFRGSP